MGPAASGLVTSPLPALLLADVEGRGERGGREGGERGEGGREEGREKVEMLLCKCQSMKWVTEKVVR